MLEKANRYPIERKGRRIPLALARQVEHERLHGLDRGLSPTPGQRHCAGQVWWSCDGNYREYNLSSRHFMTCPTSLLVFILSAIIC